MLLYMAGVVKIAIHLESFYDLASANLFKWKIAAIFKIMTSF